MHQRLSDLRRRLETMVRGDDYDRDDGRCRSSPEWLVVTVNNFCNLHCRMCDVGVGAAETPFYANLIGDDPRNMSLELFETILDQAIRFHPAPRIGLAFTEPLLHKDIVPLCEAVARRKLFGAVTTNGYLLPRLAEALAASGLDFITISVDGSREVHDRVRGASDSFERIYTGIERLNEARRASGRGPEIQLSYTITDENYTDMARFAREVTPLRPASLAFSHLNFVTAEMAATHNARYPGELATTRSNLGPMVLESIDLDAMWHALGELEAVAAEAPWRFSIVPDFARAPSGRSRLEVFYRSPLELIGGSGCTDPWRMMMIQTDGTVIPAHGRCYHFPVGRVPDESLPAIWNSPRFLELRGTLKAAGGTLPACSRCCGVIGKPA